VIGDMVLGRAYSEVRVTLPAPLHSVRMTAVTGSAGGHFWPVDLYSPLHPIVENKKTQIMFATIILQDPL